MPKFSVGESFLVALISGIEKNWRGGGGGLSPFSIENFLSQSAKKIPRENPSVFHFFRVSKKFG